MTFNRTTPVLVAGFSTLLGLVAVSGIFALRQARETYKDVSVLSDRYRRTDRVLNSIASGIYVVGVLARDYLLDPSATQAAEYRTQMVNERHAMDKEFVELKQVVRASDQPRLQELQKEVEGYWNALDPLFTWTLDEKGSRSWNFLHREVLPRRRAALAIAQEIGNLAQANFEQQKNEIDRKQSSMAALIARMLLVTVLLSAAVAAATMVQLIRLERHSRRQRLRAQKAEEELRRLSRQLLQAHEDERKALSRELHDEVGQMLTALRMELKSLNALRDAGDEEFGVHFEGAKSLAEQSLRALRDMAMGLRPSMLDDLGLGSALQWQARQFSKRTGVPVNVTIEDLPATLPETHRTCIYRMVQEALTNCDRHSRAKTIEVEINAAREELWVTVRDDGVGFIRSETRGRGLGLIGMEERIRELGGRLTIDSRPGNGTTLKAEIPVRTEANEREHSSIAGR